MFSGRLENTAFRTRKWWSSWPSSTPALGIRLVRIKEKQTKGDDDDEDVEPVLKP